MPRSRKRGSRKTTYRSSSSGELSKRLQPAFTPINAGKYFFVKRVEKESQRSGWCYAYSGEAQALERVLSGGHDIEILNRGVPTGTFAGYFDPGTEDSGPIWGKPSGQIGIKDSKNNILLVKYIMFDDDYSA